MSIFLDTLYLLTGLFFIWLGAVTIRSYYVNRGHVQDCLGKAVAMAWAGGLMLTVATGQVAFAVHGLAVQ